MLRENRASLSCGSSSISTSFWVSAMELLPIIYSRYTISFILHTFSMLTCMYTHVPFYLKKLNHITFHKKSHQDLCFDLKVLISKKSLLFNSTTYVIHALFNALTLKCPLWHRILFVPLHGPLSGYSGDPNSHTLVTECCFHREVTENLHSPLTAAPTIVILAFML